MLSNPTSSRRTPNVGIFRRIGRLVADQLIQDVPEAIAVCEFDCRKPDCSAEQWASCERRMQMVPLQASTPKRAA